MEMMLQRVKGRELKVGDKFMTSLVSNGKLISKIVELEDGGIRIFMGEPEFRRRVEQGEMVLIERRM